jgi:hypothetical protein
VDQAEIERLHVGHADDALRRPPTDREPSDPALESGFIQSITWDESYGADPPAVDEEPSKLSVVDVSPRVYSLLSAILAVGVFIAGLLLLRR